MQRRTLIGFAATALVAAADIAAAPAGRADGAPGGDNLDWALARRFGVRAPHWTEE